MTDKQFVIDAARRWNGVLDYSNRDDRTGTQGAVAIALWATLNVDRLLRIAREKAS